MRVGALPALHVDGVRARDDGFFVGGERDGGVGDVRLVVWRIEVDAVPAGGEGDLGADPAGAEVVGESGRVVAGAGRAAEGCEVRAFEAAVADTAGAGYVEGGAESGVAGEHAEALWMMR